MTVKRRQREKDRSLRRDAEQWPARHPNRDPEAKHRQRRIEACRIKAREWRKKNPLDYEEQQKHAVSVEELRGYPTQAKRRALSYDAFEEEVDKRTLWEIFEGLCGICGEPVDYDKVTIDHHIPISRGGKHAYSNCQPAHAPCNRRKADKMPDEYEHVTGSDDLDN